MTNAKEILRLYLTREYSQREIALAVQVSRNTVRSCIESYILLDLSPHDVEQRSNEQLYQLLFKRKTRDENESCYLQPDFESLVKELDKPHMTKKLLWKEYTQSSNDSDLRPYSISRFNELLEEYAVRKNISLTRERVPGEILELDWSGSSLDLTSPFTDEKVPCHLFVAALPYSGYFYAEAFTDEKIRSWTSGIVNSLNFFGGVPKILKPDNCKTATIKADKYEPELNEAMRELAEYYKTVVLPARVRKPRDKNTVEATVGLVSRNIIAALRNQTFYSISDMNSEILKRVKELNDLEFQKKEGTRFDLFMTMEKSALDPLPPIPFQLFERKTVKVAPDYHIQYDRCFYSVPPKFIGQELIVKASAYEVIILTKSGEEVAKHSRGRFKGQKITNAAHIPLAHQEVLGWTSDQFRNEAKNIGENTLLLIENVLKSRTYEVQSFKSCRGILNLKKKYGKAALEEVAKQANSKKVISYKGIIVLLDLYISSFKEDSEEEINIDPNEFFITHNNKKEQK